MQAGLTVRESSMKKIGKIILSLLICSSLTVPVLAGCDRENNDGPSEFIDYVEQLHLDLNSDTKKMEVTVRLYIDGDTTHFNPVKDSTITEYNAADYQIPDSYGYIKARYLAVNTPESTGDVEKWGKTASNFTHDALAGAESIIVESDDSKWNMDSNDRFTVWIWYKPKGGTEYRNLNVELLQNGYGLAQNTETNRYGKDYALPALMQAKEHKLKIYSNDVDENYYEGDAINLSLKKLRCYVNDYLQKTVRVEGVVTSQMENSVYIEDRDPDTGLYFGISVFYGYNPGPTLRKALTIGNRVSVCGTVSEFQGTYQINGVSNDPFHPEYTTNTVIVPGGEGTGEAAFAPTKAEDIVAGKVTVTFPYTDEEGNEQEEQFEIAYGEAIMDTTVLVSNLYVNETYTTSNGGSSDGAFSLTCHILNDDGSKVMNGDKPLEIVIRTTVLYEDGVLVTADRYLHKNITVKGLVDKYNDAYQVRVHLLDFITIVS